MSKISVTKEMAKNNAIAALESTLNSTSINNEIKHINADTIICNFLFEIGHKDIVELYSKIPK